MELILNIALFTLTFLGGMLPLIIPHWNKKYANSILAFSGAFLFAVCISHILPDTFSSHHRMTGILVVIGFFLQFFLQRLTHGVEHGHDCTHNHSNTAAWSLFGGMAIHSFIEGLPLSTGFFEMGTLVPLYIAIVLHKIPSAMIIIALFGNGKTKKSGFLILALFAMVTPLAAAVGFLINTNIPGFQSGLQWIVPIVAGSFLQIATTIFYEIGNQQHRISIHNWLMIILGALAGMLSGFFHVH